MGFAVTATASSRRDSNHRGCLSPWLWPGITTLRRMGGEWSVRMSRRRIFKRPPVSDVILVDGVAETAVRRTLSFSEYSDYYHEAPGAKTLIRGSVSDAAPTVLDWEIGS